MRFDAAGAGADSCSCKFTLCTGGAIYVTDHVNITGPTLAENKATGLVGGAVVTPTLPVLTSTTFSKNEAAEMGGAIHCMDAVDLIGNNFTGNKGLFMLRGLRVSVCVGDWK